MTPDGKAYIENCLEAARSGIHCGRDSPNQFEELRAAVNHLVSATVMILLELDALPTPALDEIRRGGIDPDATPPR